MPTTEYDISRAFKRIENELIDSMMRNMKRHQVEEAELGKEWEQWQAIQLAELEEYRKKNAQLFSGDFTDIQDKIDDLFYATYNDAQSAEEHRLMDRIKKGDFKPTEDKGSFFRLNEPKLNALIMATQADFARAEYAMLRRANDQYRKIIFDSMAYANVTNDYAKAVDMATHDFLKAGINSVVYKNGARHTVADYAYMALRTGNKRAYLMGEGNAHDRYGLHTVRVNKRTHACPKCVGFLGRLLIDDVYGGGTRAEANAKGIPTLSDAMQAGFLHPNCKDIYSAYIEGVSQPAKPWTQEEVGEIVGEYNQEQQLKHAEDMKDSYERMAKYSLDPTNQQTYQVRADNWQARIDELKNTPPVPVEPPVVNVASQATPPTPVAPIINSEEAEIRQRIAEIKTRSVDKQIAEAELEKEKLKDRYNTFETVKIGAQASGRSVSEVLLDRIESAHNDFIKTGASFYADFEEGYRYVLDHLQAFEDGTYADDITARIKDLKKQAKTVQKELDKEYDALEAIIGEPNVSKLAVYTDKHTTPIKHFLDDAPTEYRTIWNECADSFNALGNKDRWGKRRKGAYYSPSEDGVWLSINSVAKGDNLHPPYQTVFHEYGHNMDYVLNRKYGDGDKRKGFTTTYKNGIFGKTLYQEADEAIIKYGRENGFFRMVSEEEIKEDAERMVSRKLMKESEKAEYIKRRMESRTETFYRRDAEKAFCEEIKKTYSLAERGDISDMFEPVMEKSYPFDAGHGKSYWTQGGDVYIRHGKEAFAEMYSSRIANEKSWELICKYFPKSVTIFNEILEVVKV